MFLLVIGVGCAVSSPQEQSAWRGRQNCNDFSIGIELEGTDVIPYQDAQYKALSTVCALMMNHYGVTNIVGHSDIAPGRKTDPGVVFDWMNLQRRLAATL